MPTHGSWQHMYELYNELHTHNANLCKTTQLIKKVQHKVGLQILKLFE